MTDQQIIAIVNQKGGVGKTTTAINVSAQLAEAGQSVLLIDLDPQGNTTGGLGVPKDTLKATSYETLIGHKTVSEALVSTNTKNLYLIGANTNLIGAEVELVGKNKREFALKNSLSGLIYNYIVIDCPPSLGLLTVNALTAANKVIIPVQTEYYALEGLSQLLNTIQVVKQSTNPDLQLMGVLLTMYDKRTSLSGQVRDEVQKYFGDQVFKTTIPRNIRLAESPSFGKTIFEHDKWSRGARAYKSLVKEVLARSN